jgi:putative transposase
MAKENSKQGKRHTEDEILKVLKEIDGGATIAAVARAHGITDQTIYRWREKYAGMNGTDLAELRSLQSENQRLKRIVARQALEIDAYKEVAEGKW